jgi:hypothetical protein
MGYFSHPDFDAYMVSIVGDNGVKFVGPPKDFDWSLLQDSVVLSHNASFDESLYLYGVTQGWWPNIQAREWHCTADMAVYCGLPRSLKGATAEAYNLKVDKTTRDNMSGKRWENMKPEFRKEVSDYALQDSELCLKLWKDYSDKWPEHERKISLVNRRCGQRGIPLNTELLRTQLETIKKELFEAESAIPWIGERPLLSRAAFDDQCRSVGIEPPASLAEGDPDAEEWLRVHGQKFVWVNGVKNWRRINSLKCKLESFDYATMPDGRFYGNIMYFGAHTGRFSGSGGNLNLQNLPKDEMFGVKMRHLIAPKEDKRLLVVDLSQIEVRTLCWLAGDHETMEEIKESEDIYEAFAIRFGLWSREKGSLRNDPQTRHKVKAMVLGCFGPETKVLTDRGWIDIVRVRDTDKVWDGTQWVHHEGLLHQGVQETISRFGVEATSDHEILTEHGWREWGEVQRSEKDLKSALVMASLPSCHMSEQRETMAGLDGIRWSNVRVAGAELLTAITCKVGKLLDAIVALRKPLPAQQCVDSGMLKLYRTQHIGKDCSIELVPSTIDATTRMTPVITTMAVAGFGYMSLGSVIGRSFLRTSSPLMDGINHISNSIGLTITKVMNRIIYGLLPRCRTFTIGGLLRACKKESKSLRRKSEVYDLKNCGPNNRFTINTDLGPIIVHNCGYGAGAPKFAMMSGMTEDEAKEAVNLYRTKMKKVKKLWSNYNTDIITSYDTQNRFTVDLPSGRTLDYGRLSPKKQNDKIHYVAMMPKNGKRVPVKLWGGLVAENASQALARDIFSHMLCKIDSIGHSAKLIMHVHDEVVVEADADKAEYVLSQIIDIMSTPPDWIPDIPLSAEGKILTKYEK